MLEQTTQKEKLAQVFAPEGLASVVTMLAPPCVLLLAQALLDDTGSSALEVLLVLQAGAGYEQLSNGRAGCLCTSPAEEILMP